MACTWFGEIYRQNQVKQAQEWRKNSVSQIVRSSGKQQQQLNFPNLEIYSFGDQKSASQVLRRSRKQQQQQNYPNLGITLLVTPVSNRQKELIKTCTSFGGWVNQNCSHRPDYCGVAQSNGLEHECFSQKRALSWN